MSNLALLGGDPICTGAQWPQWPEVDRATEKALVDVLHRRRWSVHWRTCKGGRSAEYAFARAFADYVGVAHCVSVDHGSSALVVALEALDIAPSDEVIVPAVTWVAPATSVLRVGATPVIADVDAITGCLTPATIAAALSERTRAVLLVHLACTVADLDAIADLTRQRGIALIEDCSQAHGSRWSGASVGTIGELGVFSFGASKALAGGEGGGVITNNEETWRRLQELRADSRSYTAEAPGPNEFELAETASVMGANYCMSEFSAAVLLDQLTKFDQQFARRTAFIDAVDKHLKTIDGVSIIPAPRQVDRRGVYELAFRIDPDKIAPLDTSVIAQALTAELGVRFYTPRTPLFKSKLFQPQSKRRFQYSWEQPVTIRSGYLGADSYTSSTILLHHSALLADIDRTADIAAAFERVFEHCHAIVKS